MRKGKHLPAVQVSTGLSRQQVGTRPETNLRLVAGFTGDGITCRRIKVRSTDWSPELRAALRSRLWRRDGIITAASPYQDRELLVAATRTLQLRPVTWNSCQAEFEDVGAYTCPDFRAGKEQGLVAALLDQALVVSLQEAEGYWRLSTSTRYWYGDEPITTVEGIDVIPRIAFAVQPIGPAGLAVAFDPGHLFRSEWTIEDFFEPRLPAYERQERRRFFNRLRNRTQRRKGTLLYDTRGSEVSVCYFERFGEGETCATVGPIMGHGSLYDYYQRKYPDISVSPEDSVAYVSFKGQNMSNKPVAAKLLHLRIMADKEHSYKGLGQFKTTPPLRRKEEAEHAWQICQTTVEQMLGLRFENELWRPGDRDHELLPCPALQFGRGRTVAPPAEPTREEYRHYYRDRMGRLKGGGIYRFEHWMERKVHFVTPNMGSDWPNELQKAFSEDFKACLESIAGQNFELLLVRENDPDRIVELLGNNEPSNVVIVFDDRTTPAAYYLLAHGLPGWRLKRLTCRQVVSKWNARKRARDANSRRNADRRWQNMIEHSVLDTLDQMEATPWRIPEFCYEACLAIDVGEGRRYFGMSLLICRPDDRKPSFFRVRRTWPKGDHQHEAINPEILREKMVELFAAYSDPKFIPVFSLLVLRDGHVCKDEPRGIREGIDSLMQKNRLTHDALVDVADVHKKTAKNLRFWVTEGEGCVNVLEGQGVYLRDGKTAVICCTGRATVSAEATAEPCVLVARDEADIRRVSRAFFAMAQLNYGSPGKAERLALPLFETDKCLKRRVAEDTRGVK